MRPRSEVAPRHRRVEARAARPRVHRVLDAGLVVAGALGLLSLTWWAVSVVFGLGLVEFATGSMSPGYPAGSLAVSVPLPLDQVRTGDVVTVDRGAGRPPITHRVVEVRSDGGRFADLVLQGDANAQPDPTVYTVDHLRRVVLPLPPIADLARYSASPEAFAIVAGVVTASITWAFWPVRRAPRPAGRRARG